MHRNRESQYRVDSPFLNLERVCGLVARVPGYRLEVWDLFPALPDYLSSNGSGTGSTQLREYTRGATWNKK
jgi:hypothetical protein